MDINDIYRFVLKKEFQVDLERTRQEINTLGSVLFFCLGFIGMLTLFYIPDFPGAWKGYSVIAFSFVLLLHNHFSKKGFPLWFPLIVVISGSLYHVYWLTIIPVEYLWVSTFVYTIVFLYSFHFFSKKVFIPLFIIVFSLSIWVVAKNNMPNWELVMIISLGLTLTVGVFTHLSSAKILKIANYDGLTGLMNRYYWEDSVTQLIAISHRTKIPLSIIFIDLDDFKKVNDQYGHDEGDKVLQKVGQKLQAMSRDSDCLARWGGDEFSLCLLNTDTNQAHALISRVKKELGDIGISTGIVCLEDGEGLESLLKKADKLMYAEKENKQSKRHAIINP